MFIRRQKFVLKWFFDKMNIINKHNIKNLSVKLPLGIFTAIAGVSGSGKSSLVEVLKKAVLSKINNINVTAIIFSLRWFNSENLKACVNRSVKRIVKDM